MPNNIQNQNVALETCCKTTEDDLQRRVILNEKNKKIYSVLKHNIVVWIAMLIRLKQKLFMKQFLFANRSHKRGLKAHRKIIDGFEKTVVTDV